VDPRRHVPRTDAGLAGLRLMAARERLAKAVLAVAAGDGVAAPDGG
jgi:hypothetical protein